MLRKNIEVEGGEILIQSKEGYYAVIPAKGRNKILKMLKDNCDPCINNYVQTLPRNSEYALDGTIVSELYTQRTGKPWVTAKQEGLTTGSLEDNLKLRKRLLSGEFDSNTVKNNNISQDQNYDTSVDFNTAFKRARAQLGGNKIFEYRGRKYGTNLKGEKFNPSEEDLTKHKLNNLKVKKRLGTQNKMVSSLYTDKQTVKLESEYQDWDKIKKRQLEINKMEQANIIISSNKASKEKYLILDKKRGKLHLYQGDKELSSYNVGTGVNKGDEQTKTVVSDGKVLWDEGNKMTGAGIYTVSGINPKNPHYSNAPTWNFKNENGIEVPMALHSSFGNRTAKIKDKDETNNRLSNGCINGLCNDLKDLYKKEYRKGQKLYVLPDKGENTYKVSNGKLIFSSKDKNVNRTVETLNYKPIKIVLDEKMFREDVFNDSFLTNSDEEELERTTKPFIKALSDNKRKVMQVAKINGDVYNDLAKVAFGIYGTETNYGDLHSMSGNLLRVVSKVFDKSGSSSPDYKSKQFTYGINNENNSVGLTQIRFNMLDKSERDVLKSLGIKDNKRLYEPEQAALATLGILAMRYHNQLTAGEKKDILKYLPKKWNIRSNYSERVRKNSKYLTIKQLN